ncbi:protein FADD [Periophthalmus magnuspinnatus]|uniref:protein FADD n=1 Tax=Periophthalmus magnuspinnatus TaxID=409849 RepID=UPI00145A5AB9|nr:protein FADD [Periophthalmus magnuspinnatus]
MSSLAFNTLLLDISSHLSKEQLESLKFLCGDVIRKRDQEKVDTGIKLFQMLMQRAKLGPDNTEYLSRLLTEVQRQDLRDKLQSFRGDAPGDAPGGAPGQRDKLEHAAEVLSENLSHSWRKLGRKLGLTEVKLASISRKYPTDLEETAVELVREWRKTKGEQATVEVLLQALRDCQLNLTADTVEDRLNALKECPVEETHSDLL